MNQQKFHDLIWKKMTGETEDQYKQRFIDQSDKELTEEEEREQYPHQFCETCGERLDREGLDREIPNCYDCQINSKIEYEDSLNYYK